MTLRAWTPLNAGLRAPSPPKVGRGAHGSFGAPPGAATESKGIRWTRDQSRVGLSHSHGKSISGGVKPYGIQYSGFITPPTQEAVHANCCLPHALLAAFQSLCQYLVHGHGVCYFLMFLFGNNNIQDMEQHVLFQHIIPLELSTNFGTSSNATKDKRCQPSRG